MIISCLQDIWFGHDNSWYSYLTTLCQIDKQIWKFVKNEKDTKPKKTRDTAPKQDNKTSKDS